MPVSGEFLFEQRWGLLRQPPSIMMGTSRFSLRNSDPSSLAIELGYSIKPRSRHNPSQWQSETASYLHSTISCQRAYLEWLHQALIHFNMHPYHASNRACTSLVVLTFRFFRVSLLVPCLRIMKVLCLDPPRCLSRARDEAFQILAKG